MTNSPDILILGIEDIIQDCEEQLSQSWIFTIDIEFILQNLFNCFIDVQNTSNNLNQFYSWLKLEGLELKADHTPLQVEFVLHVIHSTAQNILAVLIEHGYYNYEYFPYEFKRILTGKAIVLTKSTAFKI